MPTNYPYIRVPFANGGDHDPIPVAADPSGKVSWTTGYGPDYQRDLETDPQAKPIERNGMNELFNNLSAITKAWMDTTYPDWITPAENNGTPVPYGAGQIVWHTVSGVRSLYTSLANSNLATPSNGGNWTLTPYRVANTPEITSGVGVYPPTTTAVRAMIDAFAPAPPNASGTVAGIVILSSELDDVSQAKAATSLAVSQKLTQPRTILAETNIDVFQNLNTQKGVYTQASNAFATVANGYPPNSGAGTLYVTGQVNGKPAQMYVDAWNGRVSTRVWNGSPGAWDPWKPIGGTEPGTLVFSAVAPQATPPVGTLVMNGAAVSRTTFAALFTKIGTRYGSGDGSTTFNLPNMPGGAALLSSVGRTNSDVLSTLGENMTHTHAASTAAAGVHNHTGTASTTGAHTHTTSGTAASAGAHLHTATTAVASGGAHTHTVSGTAASAGAHTHDVNRAANANVGNLTNRVTTADGSQTVAAAAAASAGAHTHTVSGTAASGGAHAHTATTTIVSNGAHTHATSGTAASAGDHAHALAIADAGSHSHTVAVTATGGASNLAAGNFFLPCITY